jgi:hypothetical protein
MEETPIRVALRALHAALAAPTPNERRESFHEFMIALEEVGWTWPATPGDVHRTFLDESAALLARPESPLWLWLTDAYFRIRPIEHDDDLFAAALHDRSALQFLLDLYRDTPAGQACAAVGARDFDEEIVAVRPHFQIPPAPAGVPPSHWWWWRDRPAPDGD